IEGLHAWVLEKPKPLGEILVARGSLDPADRAALDVIVARHVARHGDAEHSLAAVDPPGAVCEALRSLADAGGDPDLQASLAAVADSGREGSWSARPEPDDEERLEALLSEWEQRHHNGEDVAPEDLCTDCPELAAELGRRIDALRGIDALMGSAAT